MFGAKASATQCCPPTPKRSRFVVGDAYEELGKEVIGGYRLNK
jgi:hypothetical protein